MSCVFCGQQAHGIYAGVPKCLEHSLIPILEDTRTWVDIREILRNSVVDEETRKFLDRHWPTHAPRQFEVAALEQKLKIAEREVERLKKIIEEWRLTHREEWK